ncbi:MAG TPA: hypothetical protein EYN67_15605 [Flavobacteriales bacterium]|nr:hypothetical protein [Flavobacteriales bacterium]
MKISKKELQDMIAETIASNSSVLLETPDVPIGNRDAVDGFGDEALDPTGNKDEEAKRSLYHMSQQAQQLHDMLGDDENLSSWVADKISKASTYLEEAFKAITYDKGPGQGRL